MTLGDETPFLVPDEVLGAMLQARADRVAPGAAATVRERVRVELHERRPGGILGFLPIGDRAGAMSGWAGWAVAVAAAVLVIAVLGGRPTSDPGATAAPASPPPPSPPASAVPSPAVSEEPGQTRLVVEQASFALAVADGSLDGQIVLVNGALRTVAVGCVVDGSCRRYSFDGLPGVQVDWEGPVLEPAPTDPADDPFPGADDWWDGPFFVRPGVGRLELLGYLAGVLNNPVSVQVALEDPRGYPNASSPFDILPVDGYLVDGCKGPTEPCDGLGPMLTDAIPGSAPDGGRGAVTVIDPAPSPGTSTLIEGPFLVRFERPAWACPGLALCMHPAWGINPTVLGRFRAEDIVRVDLQP